MTVRDKQIMSRRDVPGGLPKSNRTDDPRMENSPRLSYILSGARDGNRPLLATVSCTTRVPGGEGERVTAGSRGEDSLSRTENFDLCTEFEKDFE